MKQFLVLSTFFISSLIAYGQNTSWAKVLRNADSVYLVSHGLIKGTSMVLDDSCGIDINQRLFVYGKLNNRVVKEKALLPPADTKQLINILSYKSNEVTSNAKCYVPEHAIIIVKGERLSYIEMSFGCQLYETSDDIKLPPIKEKTWKLLAAFFKAHGIEDKQCSND